ncbi:MAG: single-stranded DNA-binding protein [Armatimonadetes bacterium]|nr:single-stranded DNA-binding protein [Armatimonadota bacterium]
MLNRVVLIGRMANDPELKYTPSGVAVCTFRLAVDRIPNAQGEREADFIDIVAWRQRAEFAANYLGKGRLVAVDGRLQIRSWVAQDGTKRRAAEVVADILKGLDRPKEQQPRYDTHESAPPPSGDDDYNSLDTEDPFADE